LLSVIGEYPIREEITFLGSSATPAAEKITSILGVFIEHLLPEVKEQVGGNVSDLLGDNRLRDNTIDIDKAIAEGDDKQHCEEPKLGRHHHAIHDGIGNTFDILNHALNRVLMLIIGLRLLIFDTIKPDEIKDFSINLSLGIVTFETKWLTNIPKEILIDNRYIRLRAKRVASKKLGIDATKKLKHHAAMSRGLAEDGIRQKPFGKATDIGSRKLRAEVLPKGVMHSGAIILSGGIQGGFDLLIGYPHEMWFEEVKVWKTGANRVRKGRDGLMSITELPKRVHTAVESIPTSKGSGTHVKVGGRELLIQNRGVPGSVQSEEHMRVAIEV